MRFSLFCGECIGFCRTVIAVLRQMAKKNAVGITIQRRAEHGKQQKAEYAKYGG